MSSSRVNRPSMGLARVARYMKGSEDKIAVLVGAVTDDIRLEGKELPKLKVAALKFSEGARARIVAKGGECLTFDQLALLRPRGENTILLRGRKSTRDAVKHFGAPGVPNSTTQPKVRSEGRKVRRPFPAAAAAAAGSPWGGSTGGGWGVASARRCGAGAMGCGPAALPAGVRRCVWCTAVVGRCRAPRVRAFAYPPPRPLASPSRSLRSSRWRAVAASLVASRFKRALLSLECVALYHVCSCVVCRLNRGRARAPPCSFHPPGLICRC